MSIHTLELQPSWLDKPASVTFEYAKEEAGTMTSPPTSEEVRIVSVMAKGLWEGDPPVNLFYYLSDEPIEELYVMITAAQIEDRLAA